MAIVVEYAADPTLQATAAALGSGAAVANEQDWRERALAEQQYQFDQEYDWRVQQAALQDRLARYEMGNRTALGFGQLQSNNYNNQLDYMLGQQTLAQRDEQLGVEAALQSEQQQQLTNRAQMSQLGQIARQQQQQKFESAMADRKAAEDWLRTASPRQAAQFRRRWEERSGLSWNAPEEAMAAEEESYMAEQRNKLLGMLQAPDGSGELMAPESIVDAMMELEPDKRIDAWNKIHDTWTRRKKDEQAIGEADRKLEEQAAKDQQKEESAAVKEATKTMRDSIAGEREWRQSQEEYSRDIQDYEEKMASYEAAKSAHAKMSAGGRGGTGTTPRPFTQTPPQKPVPPTPGLFADKIPTPRSPDEVQALLPGTRFIAPDGTIRVR